jgi:hypothetical protein
VLQLFSRRWARSAGSSPNDVPTQSKSFRRLPDHNGGARCVRVASAAKAILRIVRALNTRQRKKSFQR